MFSHWAPNDADFEMISKKPSPIIFAFFFANFCLYQTEFIEKKFSVSYFPWVDWVYLRNLRENLNNEYVIVFLPFYNHADHKQHFASLGLGSHWGSTGGHWSPASLTLLHLPNQPNFNLTLHPGCRIPPRACSHISRWLGACENVFFATSVKSQQNTANSIASLVVGGTLKLLEPVKSILS